jgi:hypothetical protein
MWMRMITAALVALNVGLFGIIPASASVAVDGYGECFQEQGTTNCSCDQFVFHDCDLCAILPCNEVWPEYCG